MIYLLLSVLSSTAIFVLFKLFTKYNVNTLQAIVVNYFVAFGCGIFFTKNSLTVSEIVASNWFFGALFLGFMFIAIFNVMALTAQKNGLSVASVASKMSVVIPVIFGIYVFKESAGAQKITGIILALFAVYLTSIKKKENADLSKAIYLPILLFLGSGIIDTSINYFAPDDNISLFSATIFAIAAVIGTCILIYKQLALKSKFEFRCIPLGALLGFVNYSSIYFLLMALRIKDLESSTLFTVNNVAIVAFSTLVGLMLFKEKISVKNWIGIAIALLSITLVTLAR
ncbi:DMT family transporter [Winogradskyella ursingii]|uniref:DMT family transporter n=1 Tax=Winogradskyella ursingii TaxID=2686079 RepID=UPI0015CD5CB5|nr:DMT family transporter [Winogradskyella ursingii]